MSNAQVMHVLRHHRQMTGRCGCGADVVGFDEWTQHVAKELVAILAEVTRLSAQARANEVAAAGGAHTGPMLALDVDERHMGRTVQIEVAGGPPIHGQLIGLDRWADAGLLVFNVLCAKTTEADGHIVSPTTTVTIG